MEGALYVANRKLSDASADYHDDMNAEIFEAWMREQLLPNLDQPSAIVMDNASYHSRIAYKPPNMNSKKEEIIAFMHDNNISIPNPIPVKAALLKLMRVVYH